MILKKQRLNEFGEFILKSSEMVFKFVKPRIVLSTGEFNGGITKCDGIFNKKLPENIVTSKDLPGESVGNYMVMVAKELGLSNATALLTSATMERYGHSLVKKDAITIEVFATAGTSNAGRAGERPLYKETQNGFKSLAGTINIFVFLSFSLCVGMLTRSLITITEAKSALLAELGVYSTYGEYTATGTGTDGVIVTMNDDGQLFNDVSFHSELGYLLTKAVKYAVGEALMKECFWSSSSQLLASSILTKRAKNEQDKEKLFMQFNSLAMDDREAVLEGLAILNLLEEKNAWGSLPKNVINWIYKETLIKYPFLINW